MEKRNSQLEQGQTRLVLHGASGVARCQSLLSNEFDVRRALHGQVSLAAVNQICVIYEGMNGCKNLKIHFRITSKI